MANPYESPAAVSAVSESTNITWPRWIDWVCWLMALLPILAVHFSWLVAWLVLGHQPRPYLDDPKFINWGVSIMCMVSGMLMLSIPAQAISGPLVQITTAGRSQTARVIYSAITLLILVSTFLIFRWDPLRVMDWFMD